MKSFISSLLLLFIGLYALSGIANNELVQPDNSCHFVIDSDNPNHEVKTGGCVPSIVVHDDGTASGSVDNVKLCYSIKSDTMPRLWEGGRLKGATTSIDVYGDNYITSNADCELIDGNVYKTADWDVLIRHSVTRLGSDKRCLFYSLHCRNGVKQ